MIKLNGTIIDPAVFPDGTASFRCRVPEEKSLEITWCFDSNSEMVQLFYLVNHIRTNNPEAVITLEMPYIPNARMDRVKNSDEVFTLKYFASFINSLGFRKVKVYDPHSTVSEALINNIEIQPHILLIKEVMDKTGFDETKDILFYPDAGCAKKYEAVLSFPYLKGDKKRDWRTGKIEGLELIGNVPEGKFNALIIDDICSRGGTFLHSAKKLKEAGAEKIFLYITHCEKTILEGEMITSGLIDRIYTTDSIFTEKNENIEIIKKFR